jgi:hypothetical protein
MCHKQGELNVSAAVLKLITTAFVAFVVAACAGVDGASQRPSISPLKLRVEALRRDADR